ncbi:ABC transporter ATP-binding protein [Halorussus salilacus]|uniref:DUF7546 family protein n=1 Tax=Halorussus salilacus TaxID=2953750 RepID=UPI0020A039E2|nr:ABC transporter ATP-binding protein [Halorussus salilacus]USZ69426.1 ABC transporter ATP-binding protein [Halorussus salilacus]
MFGTPSVTRDGAVASPSRLARVARALVVLTVAEALAVLGYVAVTEGDVLSLRYLAYPFVWTNAAVLAVAYAPISRPTDRWTGGALAVSVVYFLVLCWAGGLLAVTGESGLGTASVLPAVPGWGPILAVTGGAVHATLVPFKVIGYAGLAALVYAALARSSRGVLSGALGLVTCVSCTGSVLATLLAGTVGGSSVAVSEVMARSYDLSTPVFLITVAALWVALHR